MRFPMAVLLISGFFTANPARGDEPTLSGLKEGDAARVRKEVPAAFTGDLKLEEVDDVVRALSVSGSYERVVAEDDGEGRIHIVAKPIRVIRQVSVNGNRSFGTGQLKEVIGLNANERFERKKVIEAGERLKNFYGERGFMNSEIEVNFSKETATGLSVVFLVDEKKPCELKAVEIETENKELKDRLKHIAYWTRTSFLWGKKYLTTANVDNLTRKLTSFLQENRYYRADLAGPEVVNNADKTQAKLVYKLTDPFRYEFIVPSPAGISDMNMRENYLQEIYSQLSAATIERGTADPAMEAADRVRQAFLRKGYPNVEVQASTTEVPGLFLRRVRLTITEGNRMKIKEIRISGRISRPNGYYEKFVLKNSSPLVGRGYYNRQDLEKGYENLVNELRNQGYLRAKVQSSRVENTARPGELRVVLVMDEGPLTQLRTITFTGAASFPHATLANAISLKANSALRLSDLEKSLGEIVQFYRSQGFLEARVTNDVDSLVQYNDRGTQANVRIDIYEGPKVFVNSVAIEGNSFTKSDVILRTAALKSGEVLTPEKIDEAEARLNRLGTFQRASIRTLEEGTNVSQRNVVISVAERDPGIFRMGAGVSSERDLTVRGFIGLGYNNLFGTARGISGRAEVKSHVLDDNYPQYEIVAGYLEPFVFNSLTRGRVNLTRSERVFEVEGAKGITPITASNKVAFFLERDLDRHWTVNWKLWQLDARYEFERHHRPVNVANSNIPSKQQIATVGPLIDVNFTNDRADPTRGHKSFWSMDYSHPSLGSSELINYLRTEAGHTRLFPLMKTSVVLASSLRAGYLRNLSRDSESGVPASQAFFLGGISSIRGFSGAEINERVPPDNPPQFTVSGSSTQLLIKSESHYFLFKNDLRFPITGNHGGVLFYDGGLVKVTGVDFGRPYRDSVGFGYRYNTPVGPFVVDVGFKINPRENEDKFKVHFSFGNFQ
jgi:outer membrane protein insertion porin family